MKRSLGTTELHALRPLVPDTADDPAPAVEPSSDEPAPVRSAEPNAAEHGPTAFPGPFAYVPRPAALEDGHMEPGSASSASSGRDVSQETVVGSGSLARGAVTVRADAAEGTGRSDLARGEEDMA